MDDYFKKSVKKMKNKIMLSSLLMVLGLCSALSLSYRNVGMATSNVSVAITSSDTSYLIGETVSIDAKITNASSEAIYLPGSSDGFVGIEISTNKNRDYRNYVGPEKSFTVDGVEPSIKLDPA